MHTIKYCQGIQKSGIYGAQAYAAIMPLGIEHNRRLGNLVTQVMRVYQNLQVKGKLFHQYPVKDLAQHLCPE